MKEELRNRIREKENKGTRREGSETSERMLIRSLGLRFKGT